MSRRKLFAILIVLAVVSSGTLGWYFLNLPTPVEEDAEPVEYEPHPYNSLNWWDIAADLGDITDLLTPLGQIVARGNRYNNDPSSHANYLDAADYLINRLESWGIPTDYVGTRDAVLGLQEGYGSDNRAIVFGAHLDSDSSGGAGVRQNAAGAAAVVVIASILSQFRLPVDMYYCFFSWNTFFIDPALKERALYGSKEIAALLVSNNVDVIATFNFDELIFVNPIQELDERLVVQHERVSEFGYHKTKYIADLLVAAMQGITGYTQISAVEDRLYQTDHFSFWEEGYPAVNVISGHTVNPDSPPQDSITSSSYDLFQAVDVARAAAAVGVYLALQGNGEDTTYKLQTTLPSGVSSVGRTVMTVPQILTVQGTKSVNGTLSITMSGGTIEVSEVNFTLTSETTVPIGPVQLLVLNTGNESVDFELYLHYQSDTDGNGVRDSEQYSWPDPDPPLDWDKDGLSDVGETLAGTDMFVVDTDGDTIGDWIEVRYGLDPIRDDTAEDNDEDGLSNIREIQLGTHPGLNDTDSDGMDDFWEVLFHTDPLVNDSMLDPDNDTLTNIDEYNFGADPLSADGDHDGVPDAEEVDRGMNPLSGDTDQDGLRDALELLEGLDPLTPDYDFDLSPDGPDHNPRINAIVVILAITLIPVAIGTLYFSRKIK